MSRPRVVTVTVLALASPLLLACAQWTGAPPNPPQSFTQPADPARGQAVFQKRCTGCHSLTQNREGPRLQGIYGRPSATIAGFPYSAALRSANIAWNDQTLEQWLTDPDAFLPGNNMDFRVARPQERKDIIAYFKQSAAGIPRPPGQ